MVAFCRHIKLDIRRFVDVGAGTGWWTKEFLRQYRRCKFIETYDASPLAAKKYGHRLLRAELLSGHAGDLVVCRDVLRYLTDRNAKSAIRRLAKKCRGALYLHVLTRDDDVDEEGSDMSGSLRSARWYLRELASAGFRNAGMGLFVSKNFSDFDPFAIDVL